MVLPALHHLSHALVRASAGTGKTHALVTRYVAWVEMGIEPQHIVAITFTRKAAGELRQRIRSHMAAAHVSSHVQSQLAHAPITNFHGLCLQLLEELRPGALGDGAIRVLGEAKEDMALFIAAAESCWFARTPAVAKALAHVAPWLRIDTAFLRQLWSAISLARECAQPLGKALWGHYDGAALQAQVHDELVAIRDHILAGKDILNTPASAKTLAQFLAAPMPLKTDATTAWRQGWTHVFAQISRRGKMGQLFSAEDAERIKEMLPAVEAETRAATLVPALCTLTQAAYDAYTQAKAHSHAIDFADLIERTIAVLSSSPQAHRVVRERVRAVLVDEAQDTNAMQRTLVRLLAGFDGPAQAETQAGLIVVGDWKQSIYTFRGADPDNFANFAQDVSERGGESTTLALSYRSVAPMVAGINALGHAMFAERYEPLEARPMPEDTAWPPNAGMTWLALSRTDGGKITLADDAWATAQKVRALIDAGTAPADIAILLANLRSAAPIYLQALAKCNVPVIASGSGDLLQQPDAHDLLALLAWLVDETCHLDGAIALSAPLFGLSDSALYALLGSGGRQEELLTALRQGNSHVAARCRAPADQDAVAWAAQRMPELIAWATTLPPDTMLRRLDQALDLRALYQSEPATAAQRLANFDRLMHMASQAPQRGQSTVADFVAALRWRIAHGMSEPQGASATAQRHAVVLSSVHASKGLQWPIVILPNLQSRSQQGGGAVLFHRRHGMVFAPQQGKERLRTRRYLAVSADETESRSQEMRRLLYVAVTRARHEVIFIAPAPADCQNTGFAKLLAPWMLGAPKEVTQMDLPIAPAPSTPADSLQENLHQAHQDATDLADAIAHTPHGPRVLPQGTALRLSVSDLLDGWDLPHHERLGVSAKLSAPADQAPVQAGALALAEANAPASHDASFGTLSDAEAGTLAHAILCAINAQAQTDPTAFVDGQLSLLGHHPQGAATQAVRERLMATLQSPIGRRLTALTDAQRRPEWPFRVQVQAHGFAIDLAGRLDLLVWDNEGPLIIDYKLGSAPVSGHRHRRQLQIYAWALAQMLGHQGPIRTQLVYLGEPEQARAHTITPAQQAQVPIQLMAWAAAQATIQQAHTAA